MQPSELRERLSNYARNSGKLPDRILMHPETLQSLMCSHEMVLADRSVGIPRPGTYRFAGVPLVADTSVEVGEVLLLTAEQAAFTDVMDARWDSMLARPPEPSRALLRTPIGGGISGDNLPGLGSELTQEILAELRRSMLGTGNALPWLESQVTGYDPSTREATVEAKFGPGGELLSVDEVKPPTVHEPRKRRRSINLQDNDN